MATARSKKNFMTKNETFFSFLEMLKRLEKTSAAALDELLAPGIEFHLLPHQKKMKSY